MNSKIAVTQNYLQAPPLFFVGLFLIVAILRAPSLFSPVLDPDETIFANAARMILDGGVLYHDFIDHKPPLLYYVFAFFMWVIDDLRFIHLVAICWVWLSCVLMYKILDLLYSENCAVLGALLMALFSSNLTLAATSETLMTLPILVAVFLFFGSCLGGNSCGLKIFFSGIAIGCASLIKHQGGVAALPIIILLFFSGQQIWRKLFYFCTGIALSYLPWFIMALYEGNLNEFIRWGYLVNLVYLDGGPDVLWVSGMLKNTFLFVIVTHLLLCIFAAKSIFDNFIEIVHTHNLNEHSKESFGLMWLLVSVVAVTMGFRFYRHYYIQLTAPLVFLAAPSLLDYLKKGILFKRVNSAIIWFLFLAPAIGMTLFFSWKIASRGYYHQSEAVADMIDYVIDNVAPNERFFLWGNYGNIAYASRRKDVSPFAHVALPLGNYDQGAIPDDYDVAILGQNDDFVGLVNLLKSSPPKIILDFQPSDFRDWGNFKISLFPALNAFIQKNYLVDSYPGGVVAYKLKRIE